MAASDRGPLPIRRDVTGMLEVEAPNGPTSITLKHRPGLVERLGLALSTLAAAIMLLACLKRIVRRQSSSHDRR
jgi:hypothetical protein